MLNNPPSIPVIKGLTSLLSSNNFQLIAASKTNLGGQNSTSGNTTTTGVLTSRIAYIPTNSTNQVQLVFGNYNGGNSLGENPGQSLLKIKVSLEYLSSSGVTSETGIRVPVTFNGGKRFGEVDVNGLLFSDPTPFTVIAGTQLFVRVAQFSNGSGLTVPTGTFLLGGSGSASLNNGEGTSTLDHVDSSSVTQAVLTGYGPCAILGYIPYYVPTVGILGDSICDGTSDGGYGFGTGGYLQRAIEGQTSLINQYPLTPKFAHVKCARAGEVLRDFVTATITVPGSGGTKRTQLALLASTIISEYATNDLTLSLSVIQANYLTFAKFFLLQGKYYVASTLTPRTSSTDGFITTANQTIGTSETTRVAFNNWLRDTSSSGFASQTGYKAKVSIFDAANAVEVNSSNVLTQNGGYWIVPTSGTPVLTGTITSASSTGSASDSSKSMTQDQYKGFVFRPTSGTLAGTNTTIFGNSSVTFQFLGLASTLAVGVTYQVYQCYTVDGIHPTSLGHQTIALTFNTNLIK